jgi:hypothetical protein
LALIACGMIFLASGLRLPWAGARDVSSDGDAAAVPAVASQPPPDGSEAATPVPSVQLTSSAAEVVKLAQAGMGEDVLLAFIGATKNRFSLGSDQIVYLNDLGISGIVVKAMIQRDAATDADAAMVAATNAPPVVPDLTVPYPPDDNSGTPMPPMADDTGAMLGTDNPGDYASADDAGYFYDSLAPYGSWVYVSGAGFCWQPTVYTVDRTWRPYSDRGRWLYTDSGWYWQSDYSWGWAPFHYGRWLRDAQRGWVWAPNRVWGPAWVSWRQSAEYCGWAPLPPAARFVAGVGFRSGNNFVGPNFEFGLTARRYIFIPLERMTDTAPARYSLLPGKSAELYQQTRLANNFKVENGRVVSRSIDPQAVSKLSGTEIRPAEIQELAATGGKNVPAEHLAKHDDKLVIYHPQLPKPDLNFAKKIKATAAGTAGSNYKAVYPANHQGRSPVSEPMVLGRSPETLAAQAEHKSFILMTPDRPLNPPGYTPGYTPQPPYGTEHHDGFNDATRNDPVRAPQTQVGGQGQRPYNYYSPPQSYYPQSSVLTPSRSQNNTGATSAPYYQGQQNNHSEAPANHPAPVYTPPASRPEAAPAPAYHPPPAPPAESHSSPPPAPSSSSSSSSGHNH